MFESNNSFLYNFLFFIYLFISFEIEWQYTKQYLAETFGKGRPGLS